MRRYGFIAQELEKVMPELVRDHKDNTRALTGKFAVLPTTLRAAFRIESMWSIKT